ncbi:hypothetical protein GGR51DRAFT_557922 [Nemania sp. FL0031]|nr:hypothetical protein GGR51DRAFT_557922 [Nemania sp. FL0031]
MLSFGLERIHAQHSGSCPVCIHRPSTIVREGDDAVGSRASLDWVNMMLHHARKLRCVPRFERRRGAFDLVLAQTACESLVSHVMHGSVSQEDVSYTHLVGDRLIPLDQLDRIGLEESEEGELFNTLPLSDWTANAVADGLHPAVVALIEMMDVVEPCIDPIFPRLLRELPAIEKVNGSS